MSGKSSTRTQAQRRSQSRRQLLDALVRVILRDGIRAATCSAVGEEAGLSRGLVAVRLGKREAMFRHLVEDLVSSQMERLDRHLASTATGAEMLRCYVDLHFDDLAAIPGYRAFFVLVAGRLTDAPLLQMPVDFAVAAVRRRLTEMFTAGQKDRSVGGTATPEDRAAVLGSYLLGTAMVMQIESTATTSLREGAYALIG